MKYLLLLLMAVSSTLLARRTPDIEIMRIVGKFEAEKIYGKWFFPACYPYHTKLGRVWGLSDQSHKKCLGLTGDQRIAKACIERVNQLCRGE